MFAASVSLGVSSRFLASDRRVERSEAGCPGSRPRRSPPVYAVPFCWAQEGTSDGKDQRDDSLRRIAIARDQQPDACGDCAVSQCEHRDGFEHPCPGPRSRSVVADGSRSGCGARSVVSACGHVARRVSGAGPGPTGEAARGAQAAACGPRDPPGSVGGPVTIPASPVSPCLSRPKKTHDSIKYARFLAVTYRTRIRAARMPFPYRSRSAPAPRLRPRAAVFGSTVCESVHERPPATVFPMAFADAFAGDPPASSARPGPPRAISPMPSSAAMRSPVAAWGCARRPAAASVTRSARSRARLISTWKRFCVVSAGASPRSPRSRCRPFAPGTRARWTPRRGRDAAVADRRGPAPAAGRPPGETRCARPRPSHRDGASPNPRRSGTVRSIRGVDSARFEALSQARAAAGTAARLHGYAAFKDVTSARSPRIPQHVQAVPRRSRAGSPAPRRRGPARWRRPPAPLASRACSRGHPWPPPPPHAGCR